MIKIFYFYIAFLLASTQVFSQPLKSSSNFHVFRLKPHEDLKQSISQYAIDHNIKAGVIITCVGSLEQFNIRFANQREAEMKKGHFEIVSLTGTFNDSSMHLHISVSDKKGQTIGGHLVEKNLIYTTAEIVIAELNDLEFDRETDSTYNYKELVIKRKK